MGKHKKNPIIISVSFSVLLLSSVFLCHKVRGLNRGHFNYYLPFQNFNFTQCFSAVILLMIPIELLNEVYIIKYQRRGVLPWNESHITFTLWVSRIARHINQFCSRSFVMSLSVHKEDVVRMSLVEPTADLSQM